MCDDVEKRYRQYAATMQDVGIIPHSFTAWKRVQKSAPPFALVVEVRTNSGRKPLEQQVIDASYRAYQKWLAMRSVGAMRTPRRIVTFEQWLTAKNIVARGNEVRIVYTAHDEICTQTVTGSIAQEIRKAFERNSPTFISFGYRAGKTARLLNMEIQRNAFEQHKQEMAMSREK